MPPKRTRPSTKSRVSDLSKVLPLENNDRPTKGVKRKKKTRNSDSEPDTKEDALEERGVSIPPHTSRDMLLELLGKHVRKKRPRVSKKSQLEPPAQDSQTTTPFHPTHALDTTDPLDTTVSLAENDVNYDKFDDKQLIQMLQTVGLDTGGLARDELLRNCKTYTELILLPSVLQADEDPTASTSNNSSSDTRAAKCKTNPIQRKVTDDSITTPSTLEAGTSVSLLPSLEHKRFLHPRPHPTILSSTSPAQGRSRSKGKSKAKSPTPSESDWNPEEQSTHDSEKDMDNISDTGSDISFDALFENQAASTSHPRPSTSQPHPSTSHSHPSTSQPHPSTSQPHPSTTQPHPSTSSPGAQDTQDHSKQPDMKTFHILLMRSNKKVESLETELKALTQVVHKMARERIDHSSPESKRSGGRTADRMRFHVDTLIGVKHGEDLPPPGTPTEESSPDSPVIDSFTANDPCFPWKHGPGHDDATPQQLKIMKNMLEAAGISCFRPNFSKSITANENKWYWNVCLKIFNKLVECGEYTGVVVGGANDTFIKKCLATYTRSLSKRYRLQSWTPERLKTSQSKVRQSSRLQQLKKLREKVVFSKPNQLFRLAIILENACSDDETDQEETNEDSNHGRPCLVRILEWRSEKLKQICNLLDSYTERSIASIPKLAGKKTGRPPRPRVRRENGPLSKLPAPSGLPVDCYCQEWLQRLAREKPLEYSKLEVDPVPALGKLILTLKGL